MTEAVNLGIALTDVEIIGDITLRFFAKQKYKAICPSDAFTSNFTIKWLCGLIK